MQKKNILSYNSKTYKRCTFVKMGTRILPKRGQNTKKLQRIEKAKKKRLKEWKSWWM